MRDILAILGIILGFIGALFLLAFLVSIPISRAETNKWNNGIHKDCGGHWQYEQAVGHDYITSYMYICDKCGVRKEFNTMR